MSEGEREGERVSATEARSCCGAIARTLENSNAECKFWWSPQQKRGGGGDQLQKAERQAFVSVAAASRIHALEPCLLPRLGCGREEAWVGLGSG